ncbi:major facilitator superfamily domain-containing protein [Chytriomyces sp. MP71]|nr:major facilitator superfamily domain-containing protein [Chytriomyces sp. MP71]
MSASDFLTSVPEALELQKLPNDGPAELPAVVDHGPDQTTSYEVAVALSKAEFAVVILSVMLAIFLSALDQGIYAVAIPAISSEFQSLEQINWVNTGYRLTNCAFMPLFAQLANTFGRKPIFIGSILIFEFGSALCGSSQSMIMLIVARAIAGLGAAGIFGLADIIVVDLTPIRERGKYYSLMTLVWTVASVLGPLIGGLLIDHFNWRWIFYINLPLGAIILPLVNHFLRLPNPKHAGLISSLSKIDWLGSTVLAIGICTFLVGVQDGGTEFEWNSATFISLMLATTICFAIFIYIEGRIVAYPVIPLNFFKQASTVGPFLCAFSVGMMMLQSFYLPLWFQVVLGVNATDSGLRTLPLIIGMLVTQTGASFFTSKTGISWPFIPIGGIVYIIGTGLSSTLTQSSPLWQQLLYVFLIGAGPGIALNSNLVSVQVGLTGDEISTVICALNLLEVLGSTVSPAIGGAIFNARFATDFLRRNVTLSEAFDLDAVFSDPTVVHNPAVIPEGSQLQTALIGTYTNSIDFIFLICVVFGGLLVMCSMLVGKAKLPAEDEENADG